MQDGLEVHIMRLSARLAYPLALHTASAIEYYDYLQSPGMTPCVPDDFSIMPTITIDRQGVYSRL